MLQSFIQEIQQAIMLIVCAGILFVTAIAVVSALKYEKDEKFREGVKDAAKKAGNTAGSFILQWLTKRR